MVRLRTNNFSFPGHRTDGLLHKTKSFHRRAWAQNKPGENKNYPKNQVVCAGMRNMTEAQCDNPTNETKKMVLNLSQTHFNPIFLPRSVKRRQACWRIFCCWKMSDRSYFASWLDPFQTGGIASLLLLTLWQNLRRYSSLNLFCAQVWPETTTFTLLLGNESDLCWIWSSCHHWSRTQVSHSFKVLATLSISLRLPSFYYMLPSLGISLGGQFFVFFQVFLIGCCYLLRFWSKSVGVSR